MSGALLSDHGIDTVRFRWREEPEVFQQFSRRPEGVVDGYRGERFVDTELGRIGAFRDGLVYLEGRASAIKNVDPGDHELLSPEDLRPAELVAQAWVQDAGVLLSGEAARLGRADLASELRFSNPREGSAFLHSIAGLDVPWGKIRADGLKGGDIETVSIHGTSGKTIYLRAYDKGVESGSDPAGSRIRVERQKRYRKEREPSFSDFISSDLGRAYLGREFAKLSQLESALLCDLPDAMRAVMARARSWQQAIRLAGYLAVGDYMRDEMDRATVYRYDSDLRSLGIFYQRKEIERLEVPVGRYFQTLGAAWAA